MIEANDHPLRRSGTKRVRRLEVREDHFALKAPFRISRENKHAIDLITVTVSEEGFSGRGEGVPYPRYGETVAETIADIERIREFIEHGGTRVQLLDLLPPGAGRNALDCALWDLEARATGRTVADIIGLPSLSSSRTALTISLDTPEAMAIAAAAMPSDALIKVKVDHRSPRDQIMAVRQAAGSATLIVDPNESWDEPLVRELQPMLAEIGVAMLEQPVPAGSDDWLAGYLPVVPICADESIHTVAELPDVRYKYQMINLKLDKAGGLTAALELAIAARAEGLQLMTGCMVCSSLSIAPALLLAPLSAMMDLDGPLWLTQDRAGGVVEIDGRLVGPAAGFWGQAEPATKTVPGNEWSV